MRLGQLLRGLAALGVLVALLGGVPYGLVRFVGWPLPRRVPSWHAVVSALGQHGMSDIVLIDILAVILWIAWAVLVLAVVVEALTMAQSRAPRRVLIAGHFQPLAGALLGAVVLSLAASFARSGGGVSLARPAVVMPIRPPNATNGTGATNGAGTAGRNGNGVAATNGSASESGLPDAYLTAAVHNGTSQSNGMNTSSRAATSDATYVVADGDTLWSIAADRLGDASRWPAIFELNRGVPQRDGGALDNPHWIYPGWVLRLPVSAMATPSTERPPAQRTPEQRASGQRTSPGPSGPVAPTAHVPASIADPIGPTGPIAPGSSVPLGRTNPTTDPIGRPVGAHSADSGRPPAVDPGATDSRAAAGGNATDHSAVDHGSPETEHEPAIELSATDRVGGALVLAILGALVSLRLRRRQRYRPRAPRPGRNLEAPALTPTLRALLVARSDARAADDRFLDTQVSERLPLTSIPSDDGFAAPDRIEVGTSQRIDGDGEDATVQLALGSWPGLVLVGEGAEAALRAWLSALLARSGPYNVEVTTTTACAQRLFRGLDVPSIWPLSDAADVLFRAEGELISRTRTFEERDVVDAAAFRLAEPAEPFPFFVVLLDELPDKLTGRWEALSAQASRLGATTILLGGEAQVAEGAPAVAAIDVDCSVVAAEPRSLADVLFGIRSFALSLDGAADLLAPIIAVHSYGGPDDTAADEEDRLRSEVIDVPADEPGANSDEESAAPSFTTQDAPDNVADDALSAEPVSAEDTGSPSAGEAEPEKATTDPVVPSVHELMAKVSSHRWVHPQEMTAGNGDAPTIDLHVLGMARAEAYGSFVDQGLRETAYALLGWFALRPDGATIEAAAEALWPGVSRKLGHDRFWTALGNARGKLGRPPGTEEKPNDILVKSANAYVPDAAVLDVDLWRFEEALHAASRATDLDEQAAALATALASYGGEYCSTIEGIWIEEARVDLHRRALDAAIALAEIHERRDRLSDAITALEWAVALDPICEEAVGRLVVLLGRLGRFDHARRAGDVLKGRLAEFDLDPGPATTAALVELRRREQAAERRRRRNREGDGGQ